MHIDDDLSPALVIFEARAEARLALLSLAGAAEPPAHIFDPDGGPSAELIEYAKVHGFTLDQLFRPGPFTAAWVRRNAEWFDAKAYREIEERQNE